MIMFKNNHQCVSHLFGVSGLEKVNQSSNVQFFAFAKNSTCIYCYFKLVYTPVMI